jgi:hypothetical protein
MAQRRPQRLHLSVGPSQYLPVLLRLQDEDDTWFGDPEMNELLSILHASVPSQLAALLQQRLPTSQQDVSRGATIAVAMTFQPTTSRTWLICNKQESGLQSVPFVLICDVRRQALQSAPLTSASQTGSLDAFQ